MELAECIHPVVNPVNEEKHTMLVHNEHKAAVSIGKIESEVNNILGGVGLQPERHTILKKLKELFSTRQQGALSSQDCVNSSPDQCVPEETKVNANLSCDPFDGTVEDKTSFEEHRGEFAEVIYVIHSVCLFLIDTQCLALLHFLFHGTVVPLHFYFPL
jgi:hypothetical protein